MPSHLHTVITESMQSWIAVGYQLFATEGPRGLKVEVIARKVEKSKSSFYHHFADLEVFTSFLLNEHLERAKIIAYRESQCERVIPDLIDLLLDVKLDLFFNRQLRVNRNHRAYEDCLAKSNRLFESAMLDLWASELELENKMTLANDLFKYAIENFYLQLTEENLTYEWLENYFLDMKAMVKALKKS
ncbi:MAG: TetR/AcrR family transcriptional regulator [Flammeovirgaceae bacterium]